jgi:hypothetical protein
MKKTVDEKLNDILQIEPTVQLLPAIQKDEDTAVQDDYEYARNNLRGLIENGKVAMENIIFLAKEGESPRAYEVVGQLIKTLAETNKDLLDLAKKSKELRTEEKSQPTQVNNNLFVGSTAELQKLLKKNDN